MSDAIEAKEVRSRARDTIAATAGDAVLVYAAAALRGRLREPAGRIRHRWAESPGHPGAMNINATFPLCSAWLKIDPSVATDLLEAALDVQRDDGFIPALATSEGPLADAGPALPLLAQATLAVARATDDAALAKRLLAPVARQLSWCLRTFAKERIHQWPSARDSLVPELSANEVVTVDLTALLIAEIQAIEALAPVELHEEPLLKELLGRKDQLADNLESFFWDPSEKAFRDRKPGGEPARDVTAPALLPLLWRALPDAFHKPLLARLCRSRAFGLADGVPLLARTAGDPLSEQRPAILQFLFLEALRRADARRELAVFRAALRTRMAAQYHAYQRVGDDLAGAGTSEIAPALAVISSVDAADAAGFASARRPESAVAARRQVGLVLAGVILLLLAGLAAGSRSLEALRTRQVLDAARADYAAGHLDRVVALLKVTDLQRDAEAEFVLGKAHYRLGQLAEAERAFRTAIALDPKLGQAWMNHALCLYQQKKPADAMRVYEQVQDLFATTRPDLVQRAKAAVDAIRTSSRTGATGRLPAGK